MKETIKKSFIGGIVFLGTILTGFFSFATYISLPTQGDGATITQTIWNDVINKINGIGNNVDTLSGSILGIGQTWQDVTASRVLGTIYTNNTNKAIEVNVTYRNNSTGQDYINVIINGINQGSTVGYGNTYQYNRNFIVPVNGTYSVNVTYTSTPTIITWSELR